MNDQVRIPDFFRNFQECSPEAARRGQDERGLRMAGKYAGQVEYVREAFEYFEGEWILPRELQNSHVILYLHGGGYVAGNLCYARGLGTALAVKNNCRVFSVGYRLAPEHPYPAALQDSLTAFFFLTGEGIAPQNIVLAGESSGGGLALGLALKIRDLGVPGPGGVVAVSPWTDLTLKGASFQENAGKDPSLNQTVLDYYACLYTDDRKNPYVSPLFGDLKDFPPALLLAGGNEILLSDSRDFYQRLKEEGGKVQLHIAPGMWHAYILYGGRRSEEDHQIIRNFINNLDTKKDSAAE